VGLAALACEVIRMLRAILFDMDGVLVDSIPSIHASTNYALLALGREPVAREDFLHLVGPPLEHAGAELLGTQDEELVAEFVAHYREHYTETCTGATLPADGLLEVLEVLAPRCPLAVATSKPEAFAVPILATLGAAEYFQAICGRSLELDRATKAQSVERALAAVAGGDPSGVLMVGDRSHDVIGAAQHGVPTAGVLHGAGSEEELRAAGARWILPDLRSLPALAERLAVAQGGLGERELGEREPGEREPGEREPGE